MSGQPTRISVPRSSFAAATVACLLGGCNTDLPDLTDADASLEDDCQPYADLLVSYTTPNGEDGSAQGMVVLGAPDGESVSLATNAVLTVGFVSLKGVIDESGDDLRFHGSATGDAQAAVYVGAQPSDLRYSGALSEAGLDIDIATASQSLVLYVEIVGLAGSVEIDSIESLQTTCPSVQGPGGTRDQSSKAAHGTWRF